jgi:T5SS/PEP-CTERM-associated repeat protein
MFSTVNAHISVIGDIDPADPSTWTVETDAYIGHERDGALTITDGYSVIDGNGYVGYDSTASGTVTVGAFSKWNNDTGLYVGKGGTGALHILDGGTTAADNVYIGYDLGGRGDVIVDSEGASLLNSECTWYYLYAGFYGTGTLEITGGSEITNFEAYLGHHTGAIGTVTVDGPNSMWGLNDLYTGNSGTGEIHITNGAEVRNSNAWVAYYPDSNGSVFVDGIGSIWSNYNLSVGQGGAGTVTITNGGTVTHESANRCYLGHDAGACGTVTVDGEGSTWSIFKDLRIGRYGTGSLIITNGGTATCEKTTLGVFTGSLGEAVIDGAGSAWRLTDSFVVGSKGTGKVSIINGGTITGAGPRLGYYAGSDGTMIIDGAGSVLQGGVGIGYSGEGTLTVTNGGIITNGGGPIGSDAGGSGTVIVDGPGSSWGGSSSSNSSNLYVGNEGTGILTITNGAAVANDEAYLGTGMGGGATVSVAGESAIWTSNGCLKIGDKGTGTLTVTSGAAVVSHEGYIWAGGMTVDGPGSTWTINSGDLHVGTKGKSVSFVITNGGKVYAAGDAYAGYSLSSEGMSINIDIDGPGSEWSIGGNLSYSSYGTGKINITNGGTLKSGQGGIFAWPGSTQTAIVNGEGSSWIMSDYFNLSAYGINSLAITDGGLVTASMAMVYGAILTVDVNSSLNAGTITDTWAGTVYNDGTIRLVAGPGVEKGAYSPFHYGTMNGDGIVQALGGIWDTHTHSITVSRLVTAQDSGGATAALNLLGEQRAFIIDSETIDSDMILSAGAGFPGTDESSEVLLTATVLSGYYLSDLESLIFETGNKILSAWEFSISGYDVSVDTPVYLSLSALGATNIRDLSIWHYADGEWSLYQTTDLAFDGIHVSFVSDSDGIYAVTTKISHYSGDFEKDGDVDGADIFQFISTENEITLEELAGHYGAIE